MQKIKLNERQLLMLQNIQGGKSKPKVLKINEDQYNRLFKEGFDVNKGFKKDGVDSESQKGDLLTFAQEVIVFIKDMLSRPESAPFSKYWAKKGISKEKLTSMMEKEGLLTSNLGEAEGVTTYVTEKHGFRGKIKEFYNTINEFGDGGYPAGADNDPNAPWNQEDSEPNPEDDTSQDDDNVVLDKEAPLQLRFYSGSVDDENLMVFSDRSGQLLVVNGERMLAYTKHDEFETYQTIKGDDRNLKAPLFYYINDKYASGEMKAYNTFDAYTKGQICIVTPEIKNEIINSNKGNNELASLLNQLPETTGAASSGAFVGGMSNGPINKGRSPEQEMGNIISDGIDPSGVLPFHSQRNGEERFTIDNIEWEYCNVVKDGKIVLGVYRYGQDMCYSYEWFNANVLEKQQVQEMSNDISEENNIDPTYTHFAVFKLNNKIVDGWEYNNLDNEEIKHYSKIDIIDNFPDFKPSLFKIVTKRGLEKQGINPINSDNWGTPQGIQEMDSATAGGESGTFAFDAPAGDGSAFWNAGNKLNKGKGDMPMIRGAKITEDNYPQYKLFDIKEGLAIGQVYKNGLGRRKINSVNKLSGVIKVRQWGDGSARDLNISKKEFGGWELISESRRILKITEEQLKKIIESDNLTSTAYKGGEMVDFDDCTKLNNNKVAQNGGCSQGDDGVVKLSKTKDSVVAEVARVTGKPINEVRLIIESNQVKQLIPLFISAIDQVDESLGYEELANAIGYIINEHYGTHLVEPFLNKLNQILIRNTEEGY
tara:strand:+ start:8259 stop:10553 length:2295 start_codon:yes stop_codon:yes gene_type:complete